MVYAFNFCLCLCSQPKKVKKTPPSSKDKKGKSAGIVECQCCGDGPWFRSILVFFFLLCVYVCAATPDKKKSGGKAQPKKEQSVSGNIACGCVD